MGKKKTEQRVETESRTTVFAYYLLLCMAGIWGASHPKRAFGNIDHTTRGLVRYAITVAVKGAGEGAGCCVPAFVAVVTAIPLPYSAIPILVSSAHAIVAVEGGCRSRVAVAIPTKMVSIRVSIIRSQTVVSVIAYVILVIIA